MVVKKPLLFALKTTATAFYKASKLKTMGNVFVPSYDWCGEFIKPKSSNYLSWSSNRSIYVSRTQIGPITLCCLTSNMANNGPRILIVHFFVGTIFLKVLAHFCQNLKTGPALL